MSRTILIRLLIFAMLFVVRGTGQSSNGTMSGIVVDPASRVIPGADVLVVNDSTGVRFAAKTNGEGIYAISNLPPGPYRMQVAKSGFKTIIKPDIVVHIEDALAINFTMRIGATSEIVTVEAGSPLINTENASVGAVIDRNFVENLPLNGRSFNTLLQLTPGVVIAPVSGGFSGGQFSVAGQRQDANSFLVDGVSANFGISASSGFTGPTGSGNAQALNAIGGTSGLVSVEALQEFRIETSSFAPEFGRNSGAQVMLNTRSGTNAFRGNLFDYLRNTVMDANNWFNDAATPPIPRAAEQHNDFGGILGGPLWQGKTFFFFSYEGARLRIPETSSTTVPSNFARTSALSSVAPFLNAYPVPNGPVNTSNPYQAQFTGSYSEPATLNATSIRIDHNFSDRFSVFGRFNDAPSNIASRSGSLSNVDQTTVNTKTLTLGLNVLFTDQVLNAMRVNYSSQDSVLTQSMDSFGGGVPPPANLFFGTGFQTGSGSTFQFYPVDGTSFYTGSENANRAKQAQVVDDLSVSTGAHHLKFGGDYRAILADVNVTSTNGVALVPLGIQQLATEGTVLELSAGTSRPGYFLTQALSLYAQDTWRITKRLTLTYGIRWELAPAPSARGDSVLASWENTGNPADLTLAPIGTRLWGTTYGNLAPRAGLVYRLNESGTLVLRAGGGTFYDPGTGSSLNLASAFPNISNRLSFNIPVPIASLTSFLPPPVSLQPPYSNNVNGFAENLKLPRSYQWNVTLEKSLGTKQVIAATYLGQAGRDLTRQEALYHPNSNFASSFLLTNNSAWSNYNALQIQYRRALERRLQALLSYGFSHSLDNASNDQVVGVSNSVVSEANDYASSSFDVRHSFSSGITWDIPGVQGRSALLRFIRDWSLDAIIVARTGFPFNASFSTFSGPLAEVTSLRPNLVRAQSIWAHEKSAPGGKVLNAAAFSIPSPVSQGNEGRNDIAGFDLTQVDLSCGRKFPFTDRINLLFRADAFNLLNHPNFANPGANLSDGSAYLAATETLNNGLGGLNPLFQEGGPRSLQLSLKLAF